MLPEFTRLAPLFSTHVIGAHGFVRLSNLSRIGLSEKPHARAGSTHRAPILQISRETISFAWAMQHL